MVLLLITSLFLIINHKNRFAYAFSLYFVSVLALIFFASLYLIKVANYPYTFSIDYKLYLYLLELRISYWNLYRYYLFSLCIFMFAPVLFYYLLSRAESAWLFVSLVGLIILFMICNDPRASLSLHYYLHTTTGRLHATVSMLIRIRHFFNNGVICFFMVLPIFLLIRFFIRSKLRANRQNAVIFIICIALMDFLVCGILLSKYWGSINPNNTTLFSLPSEIIPLADFPVIVISFVVAIMVIFVLVTFYNPFSSYALVKRSVLIRRAQILNQNLDSLLHTYKNAFWGIKNLGEISLECLESNPKKCRETLLCLIDTSEHNLETVRNALASLRKVNPKIRILDIKDCIIAASVKVCTENQPQFILKNDASSTLLLGDFYMLEEVFVNLFRNSLQAMQDTAKSGQIHTILSTEGEYLIVDCVDNGNGIPQEILEEVFTPFFTTKAITKNSGLGLTYVKKVVEAHRGSIEVTSRKKIGTRFRLIFPVIQARKRSKQHGENQMGSM